MRYSVLGFNQELAVQAGLDLTDLLLLDYIVTACASPSMLKTTDDSNQPYVWLRHDKVLADIPIIGIGEEMLKKRIKRLSDRGFIKSIIRNDEIRGRRAYYTITDQVEKITFSPDQVEKITLDTPDQVESITPNTPENSRPSVINYPSDNKLINNIDNKLNTDSRVGSFQSKDIEDFVNTFNDICKSLPRCTKVTDKRKKGIQNILKKYTQEEILQVFNNLENSQFCTGRNDRGWKADIDFILREDKFVSVLEGKYGSSKYKKDKFSEFGKVKSVKAKEEDILYDKAF